MDVHIIVDADLGVTPAQIAAAWNAGPHSATPARVVPAPPSTYDAGLLELIVVTIMATGGALVASGIQQIVNDILAPPPAQPPAAAPAPAQQIAPPVEVLELKRADGSPLLVVRRREQPR